MSIQLVSMFYMYSTQSEKQKQKVQLKDTLSVKNGEKKNCVLLGTQNSCCNSETIITE